MRTQNAILNRIKQCVGDKQQPAKQVYILFLSHENREMLFGGLTEVADTTRDITTESEYNALIRSGVLDRIDFWRTSISENPKSAKSQHSLAEMEAYAWLVGDMVLAQFNQQKMLEQKLCVVEFSSTVKQ